MKFINIKKLKIHKCNIFVTTPEKNVIHTNYLVAGRSSV